MKIEVKKEFKLAKILALIQTEISLNEDGNITSKSFSLYPSIVNLLVNALSFPDSAKYLNLKKVIRKTLPLYMKNDVQNVDIFIKTLKGVCVSEMQKPEEMYTLLTSISLSQEHLKNFSTVLLGCKIQFHICVPSGLFDRDRMLSTELGSQMLEGQMPKDYTIVTVQTKSRYSKEAIERSLSALDVVRGFINMDVNASGLLAGNKWAAVNKVVYGKIHTLHDKAGKALSYPIYFQPIFEEKVPINYQNDELLGKNLEWRLSRLEQIGFKTQISDAVIRFARALDESDNNVAVIKLWSTLESLLIEKNENRNKISSLLSVFHKNSELQYFLLENIRLYRNTNVHLGIQDNSPIEHTFLLQNCFIPLIQYYLQLEHNSLLDANKDLLLASKGKTNLQNNLDITKRVLYRFKECL